MIKNHNIFLLIMCYPRANKSLFIEYNLNTKIVCTIKELKMDGRKKVKCFYISICTLHVRVSQLLLSDLRFSLVCALHQGSLIDTR